MIAYLLMFSKLLTQIGTARKLSPFKFAKTSYCLSHFSYLIASMGLQMLWSFGLACLDGYAITANKDLTSPILLSLFVVGDWVMTKLILELLSSNVLLPICFYKPLTSSILVYYFIEALKLSIWIFQTDCYFCSSFLYLWKCGPLSINFAMLL